jgi:hypothetical protein
MAVTVPPRFRRALKAVPHPGWGALLSIGALLLAVAVALLASGAISLGDLLDGASYWRWQAPAGA